MRKSINKVFSWYYRHRIKQLEHFMQHPHEVQNEVFQELIETTRHTEWGKKFGYKSIKNARQFAERVPIQDYESLKPYIERMMYGEKNILWNGQIKWFSKSSGTTSDKSKFIPVSNESIKNCHIKGTWDTMTFFYDQHPNARQFECKSLIMGGSLSPFEPYPETTFGDVSAIMTHLMPFVARPFVTPDFETALMSNFEEKIERMAQIVSKEKELVLLGGVPTWVIVLFRRVLEITGKSNVLEVWPNLQGYIHGGVSFTPYRKQFEQFLPSDEISYQEVYNASEGYFAVQNDFGVKDMLLLLENGVYYEFLPMEEWHKDYPKAIPLSEVEIGVNYAIVISTNAGLWRYMPGDTLTFTSTYPYKIKITGRTKHFINAFGEEVMVENTDKALAMACQETDAIVTEYTVAPVYIKGAEGKGGHQWLVEFEKKPDDLEQFITLLDKNLQSINSDYEAKRHKDLALTRLRLQPIPTGTFIAWLKSKGKYSNQVKVPRLANNRNHVEEILDMLSNKV